MSSFWMLKMVVRDVTIRPPTDRNSTHFDVIDYITWFVHGLSVVVRT